MIVDGLAGRNVMVTGAGTGFGRALALAAAERGAANVVVHYNSSAAGAEDTAAEIRSRGGNALLAQANLRSWEAIRQMADEVYERLGRIDGLVNNAGDVAPEQMSWRDLTEDSIDRVLEVDIKGTLLMVHEFGSRMLKHGGGSIVNIGSTVVTKGSPRAPQYAASKYALLGITKSYARAFAPAVRVNTFAPGFMETEATLAREDWRGGRREELIASTPAGRIPRPEDLAAAALFLLSDAANHMVGNFVVCDGGYSMVGA